MVLHILSVFGSSKGHVGLGFSLQMRRLLGFGRHSMLLNTELVRARVGEEYNEHARGRWNWRVGILGI